MTRPSTPYIPCECERCNAMRLITGTSPALKGKSSSPSATELRLNREEDIRELVKAARAVIENVVPVSAGFQGVVSDGDLHMLRKALSRFPEGE